MVAEHFPKTHSAGFARVSQEDRISVENVVGISVEKRVAVSLVAAVLAGMLAFQYQTPDFFYPWAGARSVLAGVDPYLAMHTADVPFAHAQSLFYPVTALLVAAPFAWLPLHLATACFSALGCGLLAFAVSKRGLWRVLILASAPGWGAARGGQWSPLLMACALLWAPALGLAVVKPTLALPLACLQRSWRAVILAASVGVLVLLVSIAISPAWVSHWLAELRGNPTAGQYHIPALTLLGAPILIVLLRWRRSEARLVAGLACVPQNGFFYDQFPLLLIPESMIELLIAIAASWIAFVLIPTVGPGRTTWTALSAGALRVAMLGIYWPAALLVLRRPNVDA